jgi:hypothetical protein
MCASGGRSFRLACAEHGVTQHNTAAVRTHLTQHPHNNPQLNQPIAQLQRSLSVGAICIFQAEELCTSVLSSETANTLRAAAAHLQQ